MYDFFTVGDRTNDYKIPFPKECPMCNHKIIVRETFKTVLVGTTVQAVYLCPNSECVSLFIGYYLLNQEHKIGEIFGLLPRKPKFDMFDEIIERISPTFISIYNEAFEAHNSGLLQIAGPGYRKALEFLIKDYAKHITPDQLNKETKYKGIEKANLNDVINQYINDTRVKSIAKRALWIGNDETHYLRKWEKHSIDDLIRLIKLTIYWIEAEETSKDYEDEMP